MTAQLRELVAHHGGLVNQADLARTWDLSRQRVNQLVADPTFPDPVARVGGKAQELWARDEVDAWKLARIDKRRHPYDRR
jgi:predicted DNA-binding transcriptional regulator AlpA